jgi:hypothetical protein
MSGRGILCCFQQAENLDVELHTADGSLKAAEREPAPLKQREAYVQPSTSSLNIVESNATDHHHIHHLSLKEGERERSHQEDLVENDLKPSPGDMIGLSAQKSHQAFILSFGTCNISIENTLLIRAIPHSRHSCLLLLLRLVLQFLGLLLGCWILFRIPR